MWCYYKRFWRRAFKETIQFWTPYRIWTALALTVLAILAAVYDQDVRTISTVTKKYMIGFVFMYAGTFVISACRTPVLLDKDRESDYASLQVELKQLQLNPADEAMFEMVRSKLVKHPSEARAVLKRLFEMNEVVPGKCGDVPGVDPQAVNQWVAILAKDGLVARKFVNDKFFLWVIPEHLKTHVGKVLYGGANASPKLSD